MLPLCHHGPSDQGEELIVQNKAVVPNMSPPRHNKAAASVRKQDSRQKEVSATSAIQKEKSAIQKEPIRRSTRTKAQTDKYGSPIPWAVLNK